MGAQFSKSSLTVVLFSFTVSIRRICSAQPKDANKLLIDLKTLSSLWTMILCQGCRHDRGTEDQCGDIFYTFYGYRNPSASWRTVMSYNCRSGQCDNSPGTTCSTIPYLSGDYTYNGESLGGASNNCRAAVIANKECISGYM